MTPGPSLTARSVALARSRVDRPEGSGDTHAEARLYAGLRTPFLWPVALSLRGWMEARTRFFDEATMSAIAGGTRQVVIVGAGYDGRALRFRRPGIRFFEVDQAGTQEDKRRRLAALGAEDSTAVTYIAHDIGRGSLADALAAAGQDAREPSLFICEGLLLYLTRPTAERLLAALRERAAPASRLALSAHELAPSAGALARLRTGAQRALLAAIGEPRRLLFHGGEVEALLERGGWRIASCREHGSGGRRGMLVLAEPL